MNTPAIPPGQQLQLATFGMPESPPEQPVQTRQKPMHTDTVEVATGTDVGVALHVTDQQWNNRLWVHFGIAWLLIQRSTGMEWLSLDHCHGPLLALSTII